LVAGFTGSDCLWTKCATVTRRELSIDLYYFFSLHRMSVCLSRLCYTVCLSVVCLSVCLCAVPCRRYALICMCQCTNTYAMHVCLQMQSCAICIHAYTITYNVGVPVRYMAYCVRALKLMTCVRWLVVIMRAVALSCSCGDGV
jgi:hypothetical protein